MFRDRKKKEEIAETGKEKRRDCGRGDRREREREKMEGVNRREEGVTKEEKVDETMKRRYSRWKR